MTCSVCRGPVDGYNRCYRCQHAISTAGIADLVACLAYGINSQQSGNMLRHYKDDPMPAVRRRLQTVISRILFLGIVLHEPCIGKIVGCPVALRVTVPSLRKRTGTHPFDELATGMNALDPSVRLSAATSVHDDRPIDDALFTINQPGLVRGRHVLVLDDTWVTGSRAQSAALTLRAAGAAKVSILTIGRWLNTSHTPTKSFISTHLTDDYEPSRCPVTSGICP
ncbi:ComF family protein [Nocardia sp. CWNU-33]|uniref:ComF family protein n=1 Tax=Nocardia sp. CWNU-33 TaxID=3392117 RepID=UPI00398EDF92